MCYNKTKKARRSEKWHTRLLMIASHVVLVQQIAPLKQFLKATASMLSMQTLALIAVLVQVLAL
jgi:hypothetical protein